MGFAFDRAYRDGNDPAGDLASGEPWWVATDARRIERCKTSSPLRRDERVTDQSRTPVLRSFFTQPGPVEPKEWLGPMGLRGADLVTVTSESDTLCA